MAKRSRVFTMSPLILEQEDDLDLWEVVNPSDGEFSDDSFSVDSLSDDDVISLDDEEDDSSVVSSSVISSLPQTLPAADGSDLLVDLDLDGHVDGDGDDVVRDEVDGNDLGWTHRQILFLSGGSRGITYGDDVNDDGEEERGGEDVEYDDDSYDLDDELVPRSVNKKLGRERMRKLGKRGIAKFYASKKSPISQLKHGCVRGKHGFGLKFKC